MDKILDLVEQIQQEAKVQQVSTEVKDKQIADLKAEVTLLKQRPVAPVEESLKAWVGGEMLAPGVIKWSLFLSEPLTSDIVINIAHTDTKTNILTPYKWTVPAGKTSVSGTYGYKDIKQASYQLNNGTGYTPGKTAEQPQALTIVWEL